MTHKCRHFILILSFFCLNTQLNGNEVHSLNLTGSLDYYYLNTEEDLKDILDLNDKLSVDATLAELEFFLQKWIIAWEESDYESYESFYSKEFTSGKANYRRWMKSKKTLFQQNLYRRITYSEFKVVVLKNTYVVTFRQNYKSQKLTDSGSKKIKIKKEEGDWKIVEETWRKL